MDELCPPAELENLADWPKWKQSFEFFMQAIEHTGISDAVKIRYVSKETLVKM